MAVTGRGRGQQGQQREWHRGSLRGHCSCTGAGLGGMWGGRSGNERWSCRSDRQSYALGMSKELLRFGLSSEVEDPGEAIPLAAEQDGGWRAEIGSPPSPSLSALGFGGVLTWLITHSNSEYVSPGRSLSPHTSSPSGSSQPGGHGLMGHTHTPLPASLKTNSPRLT